MYNYTFYWALKNPYISVEGLGNPFTRKYYFQIDQLIFHMEYLHPLWLTFKQKIFKEGVLIWLSKRVVQYADLFKKHPSVNCFSLTFHR